MKNNKIEINLLFFLLMESVILLFFFKTSLTNLFLGILVGIIAFLFFRKRKTNKLIKIILLLGSVIIIPFVLRNMTSFITSTLLKNYSSLTIIFTLFILSFYLAKKGYHTYIKSLEISCYFYLFLKIISFFLILPQINFSYFSTFRLDFSFSYQSFLLAFIIFYIFLAIKYLTNDTLSKAFIGFSFANPLLLKILSIMIIGNQLTNLYHYPYFEIFKKIKYLNFFERMEGILSFQYLFSFFFLLSFLILVLKNVIKKESEDS